jgi:hypothetical protein
MRNLIPGTGAATTCVADTGVRGAARVPAVAIIAGALLIAAAASATPASAQRADSAAYIVRFGTDTIAAERWIRTADGLEAVSVTRVPQTEVRRWSVRLGPDGRVTHVTTADGTVEVDPAGAVPTAAGFYAPQGLVLAQAARARDTLAVVPVFTGANVQQQRVRRVGPDIFEILNQAGAVTTRAHLTSDGLLFFLETGGSTTVQRVDWFDIDALAAEFTARDARDGPIGPLSTRGTAELNAGGATIRIDYGRPAARGRTVFGGLVPFGRVWRTGADDATTITVDRPVTIGGTRLEPGTYSLYTVPGRETWLLGINRGSGMAAAMAPDAAQDIAQVRMNVRTLSEPVERFTIRLEPAANGATLRLQWERTEASVPIVVGGSE